MNSTPFKKGILAASTPIQTYDSGYFGSCNNTRSEKNTHSLSPIKEAVPLKKRYTPITEFVRPKALDFLKKTDSVKKDKTHFVSTELVKELNFNDLSNFTESLNECYEEDVNQISESIFELQKALSNKIFLKNNFSFLSARNDHDELYQDSGVGLLESDKLNNNCCSPSDVVNNNIVSYKNQANRPQGKKIDFLKELDRMNCSVIVSSVLALLSADDLRRMCCVSKKWGKIVHQDKKANVRRKEYIVKWRENKENNAGNLVSSVSGRLNEQVEFKIPLSNINYVATLCKQPLDKQYNPKFDSFLKEGQNVKNGTLMKCPTCAYAAKCDVDSRYCCTNCRSSFCGKCLSPYTNNHTCDKTKVSIVVGSKKSKRNLKRL